MEKSNHAFVNWSGGKDSALALYHVLNNKELAVKYLLTTVNSAFDRIAMHGVRESLLIKQTASIGLPLIKVDLPEMPDMETYEAIMGEYLRNLAASGIAHSIYGDIFLDDLKTYRENQMAKYHINAVFPLWQRNSLALIEEFIELGFQTIVVCAQNGLQDFCGRIIDHSFIKDLPKGIDPCGENGEFHTFVFSGPIFRDPIKFELGERVYKEFPNPQNRGEQSGFWYQDLIPLNP
jgi:uncharacterized protein (TIGR00290 family)